MYGGGFLAVVRPPTIAKFIMRTFNPELDHIDPLWKKGRDYQLVCGFEKEPLNLEERDARFNTAKSNRFLPWRNISDEIGQVPCNPGDLAYFLVGADIANDISGEWVLMEFLSEEWFEASRNTCGSYQDHYRKDSKLKKWRKENPEKVQNQLQIFLRSAQEWRENNKEVIQQTVKKAQDAAQEWSKNNPEKAEERFNLLLEGALEWRENNPERVIENVSNARMFSSGNFEIKYRCLVTGKESNLPGIKRYQKKRGIDPTPENRTRIN